MLFHLPITTTTITTTSTTILLTLQLLVVVILPAPSHAQQLFSDCRLCPGSCLTVPRSDGSCPVCICGGVALPDCPAVPAECPAAGCRVEFGPEGCQECACPQGDDVVCLPLGVCPEECQQLISNNGCPECVCETPQRVCPEISCPPECTVETGDDGCPECRCERPGICPPLPECLRGCIDVDEAGDCFTCNCTLLPDDESVERVDSSNSGGPFSVGVSTSFGTTSFEINPFDVVPFNDGAFQPFQGLPFGLGPGRRPPFRRAGQRQPSSRCPNQRLRCPSGCRIATAANGCRECFCGYDAYLCPGVPRCASRCQFLSPEDRCCRCQCPRRPTVPGFQVSVGGFPFGPRPNIIRRVFIGVPSFAGTDRDRERNCPNEPNTCEPQCQMSQDSAGCRLCVCPGDLCPRIRCPQRCIQGYDQNGCPICNCGGGTTTFDQPGDAEVIPDAEIPGTDPDPGNPPPRPASDPVDPTVVVVVDPGTAEAPTDPQAAAPPDVGPGLTAGVDVGPGLTAGVDVGPGLTAGVDVGPGLTAGVDGPGLTAGVDVGPGLTAGVDGPGLTAGVDGPGLTAGVDSDVQDLETFPELIDSTGLLETGVVAQR